MKIKVLYVEDELFLGKIVKETLEGRNFQVTMEADGANVLKMFKRVQPDICVLDIMLPIKTVLNWLMKYVNKLIRCL